jgi:transcriptional regulator with XRE-family HTH domain
MNMVKKRRFELGFSQYEVEKLSGIPQSRISLIEKGYREPSMEEKKRLAKTLRAEIQELFD